MRNIAVPEQLRKRHRIWRSRNSLSRNFGSAWPGRSRSYAPLPIIYWLNTLHLRQLQSRRSAQVVLFSLADLRFTSWTLVLHTAAGTSAYRSSAAYGVLPIWCPIGHALLVGTGQFNSDLSALSAADNGQVNRLASLGLAHHFSKVRHITRPLPIDCDDNLARFADLALLKRDHAQHGGRKKSWVLPR